MVARPDHEIDVLGLVLLTSAGKAGMSPNRDSWDWFCRLLEPGLESHEIEPLSHAHAWVVGQWPSRNRRHVSEFFNTPPHRELEPTMWKQICGRSLFMCMDCHSNASIIFMAKAHQGHIKVTSRSHQGHVFSRENGIGPSKGHFKKLKIFFRDTHNLL